MLTVIRVLVIGRIYTYTGSVVQYSWSCTPSQSIGGGRFLCWMPLVVFFGHINCVLLCDNKTNTNTRMLVTIGIRFKQHLTLGILRSAISHLQGCYCPWTLPSEYRVKHGTIGPLYVTSRHSTRIFYRGVSGFTTEWPCGVWCRGLTTCLLYVCHFFGIDF